MAELLCCPECGAEFPLPEDPDVDSIVCPECRCVLDLLPHDPPEGEIDLPDGRGQDPEDQYQAPQGFRQRRHSVLAETFFVHHKDDRVNRLRALLLSGIAGLTLLVLGALALMIHSRSVRSEFEDAFEAARNPALIEYSIRSLEQALARFPRAREADAARRVLQTLQQQRLEMVAAVEREVTRARQLAEVRQWGDADAALVSVIAAYPLAPNLDAAKAELARIRREQELALEQERRLLAREREQRARTVSPDVDIEAVASDSPDEAPLFVQDLPVADEGAASVWTHEFFPPDPVQRPPAADPTPAVDGGGTQEAAHVVVEAEPQEPEAPATSSPRVDARPVVQVLRSTHSYAPPQERIQLSRSVVGRYPSKREAVWARHQRIDAMDAAARQSVSYEVEYHRDRKEWHLVAVTRKKVSGP